MFFDSHCHLDHPSLLPHLPELIQDAEATGITGFLVPGVDPGDWTAIAYICRTYPQALPAFGVHPMHAALLTPSIESKLRHLSLSATAIGEIGLDYALAAPSREIQKLAFRTQLRVAADAGLPVLIHCRKAFGDLLAILKEERVQQFGGVMHAFSGSPESAADCIRLGLHISLAGSVTYPNAIRPPAVATSIPLERLLLETDAPDLAPEPYRGGTNLPAYLVATAERVALLRGITLEELARVTTANATRLFRIGTRVQG